MYTDRGECVRQTGLAAAGAGAAQAAAATTNGICEHVACSACGVCIVKELEETRRLYRSRMDQFRIKAVQVL